MSFEADLEALRAVDSKLYRNVRGFMTQSGNILGEKLTCNEYAERLALLIHEKKEDNPFYLTGMLKPIHDATTAIPMIGFLLRHAPAILDNTSIFLRYKVGKSQLELMRRPPILLETIDLRPDDYKTAARWFGQFATVATMRLSDELLGKLLVGISAKKEDCLVRMYDLFVAQQEELQSPPVDASRFRIDARDMSRLLQMHSAVRQSGMKPFWVMPTHTGAVDTPFTQLAKSVYGLNNSFQVTVSAWKTASPETLEAIFSRLLTQESMRTLNADGAISDGYGDYDRPEVAGIMRDLTNTAQLMIINGEPVGVILDELEKRGMALEAVSPVPENLNKSLSQNMLLTTLFPFKHLWKEFGLTMDDYHGNRAILTHLEDEKDVRSSMGRYTGDYGIGGIMSVPAQEQLEKRFPQAVPSYYFSEDIPQSEVSRVVAALIPEIESGQALKNSRMDSALNYPQVIAALGDARVLKLVNALVQGSPDDHTDHGQIFHLSSDDLMATWVPHLSKECFESWFAGVKDTAGSEWVEVIVKHRRPSRALLSQLDGKVIDSCLSQDLGL